MEWQEITTVKSFVTCPMVANLNTVVIYCGILTLVNEGTVVNYLSIFITLAPGACTIKPITAVIDELS
jgi:hypothetical protein